MNCKIAIVTAIYHPNTKYLSEQIESYETQTCKDFHVLFIISDLQSNVLVREIACRYSFDYTIIMPNQPLGPREAFGYGIQEIISKQMPVEYIALSDQDDIWLPNKLESLLSKAKLTNASLVHSNAMIVDQSRHILKSEYWKRSHRDQTNLDLLCFRNCVIGMTSMFTVETARLSIPFLPNTDVEPLHDWLLAIAAGMIGRIEYIDAGLVLYRQHDNNVIGANVRNVTTQITQLPSKIIFAWNWANCTQPVIQSTLTEIMHRSRLLDVPIINVPLPLKRYNIRFFVLIWHFIKKGSLFGLLGVLVHIFKNKRNAQ